VSPASLAAASEAGDQRMADAAAREGGSTATGPDTSLLPRPC